MIIDNLHETKIRKDLSCNMGRPLEVSLFLLRSAFGFIGQNRPTLRSTTDSSIVLANDDYKFDMNFTPLNYEFTEKISRDGFANFDTVITGQFLYEYGRAILAETAVALTRIDWYLGEGANIPELNGYYETLYKLHDTAPTVITDLKRELGIDEDKDSKFNFDFIRTVEDLIEAKNNSSSYKNAPDMSNHDILLFTYTGMFFVILGSILTFTSEELDPISYLKGIRNKDTTDSLVAVLLKSPDTITSKANLIKIVSAFFGITNFYKNVSGLTKQDSLIELIQIFSANFMSKFNKLDQIDLIEDVMALMGVPKNYNVFDEINGFLITGTIGNDNTDIWGFGLDYSKHHNIDFESIEDITEIYIPQMKGYFNRVMDKPTDLQIEKGFNFISIILNGLDNKKISTVDPRTILALTMLGGQFRLLEKDMTGRSEIVKSKIRAAIDLIDVVIVSLYNLWFNSKKFFVQPIRPKYCDESAMATLDYLKCEVNDILCVYFEFVRFGASKDVQDSDKDLFKVYFTQRASAECEGDVSLIVNKLFPELDPDVFVRECAIRGIRSFAYTALCDKTNHEELSFDELLSKAASAELPKAVIRSLSSSKIDELTGIKLIDKSIYTIDLVKEYINENPFAYMLVIYCVLSEAIQQILKENDVGNYFDFGNAEGSTDTNKLNMVVNDKVVEPVARLEDMNF